MPEESVPRGIPPSRPRPAEQYYRHIVGQRPAIAAFGLRDQEVEERFAVQRLGEGAGGLRPGLEAVRDEVDKAVHPESFGAGQVPSLDQAVGEKEEVPRCFEWDFDCGPAAALAEAEGRSPALPGQGQRRRAEQQRIGVSREPQQYPTAVRRHGDVDECRERLGEVPLALEHVLQTGEDLVVGRSGQHEGSPGDAKGNAECRLVRAVAGDVTDHRPHPSIGELDGVEEVATEECLAPARPVTRHPRHRRVVDHRPGKQAALEPKILGSAGLGPEETAPDLLGAAALYGVADGTGQAIAVDLTLDEVVLGTTGHRLDTDRPILESGEDDNRRVRGDGEHPGQRFEPHGVWQAEVEDDAFGTLGGQTDQRRCQGPTGANNQVVPRIGEELLDQDGIGDVVLDQQHSHLDHPTALSRPVDSQPQAPVAHQSWDTGLMADDLVGGASVRAQATRDKPWVMRTYSGHSTATASNLLYRGNLAKGQTGLSIAFDLPTQIGYDPDAPEAAGEVGKVGVPVVHLGHMAQLLDQIPVGEMNTSMTINATAAWLLALYVANAENEGVDPKVLTGTTQNDIVKEYLSRGTYIFPPGPSRRLIVDMVAWCAAHAPKWNPINVCSYHLQEAGATPIQELAFALATAIGVLDAVRESGQVDEADFPRVVGSISFFVNAGIRFVEETCKLRAFTRLWDQICEERYGVDDPKLRRFRYGVQVNSLGLTEQQPENNVQRIVLEMLGVTLSKSARARALQLPAWNEALGLPRPWDQQWALRMQQVLAFETDLLEYDDLFDGSRVIEAKVAELCAAATDELDEILAKGGAFACIDELKARLVASQSERTRAIETGELVVVGVNRYTESEPSPLDGEESFLKVDAAVGAQMNDDIALWRSARDAGAVAAALAEVRRVAATDENLMPATIALAHAGGTTGEWAGVLRSVFGEFRAPTGVSGGVGVRGVEMAGVAARVKAMPGGPPRLLVAKPGLDGHSNGAEQIAVAARDAGFEVVYQGIRLTPAEIAATARDEDVDLVGLSILSGSHLELVPEVVRLLHEAGVDAQVVVGGIVSEQDAAKLIGGGVRAVYTPKDYELTRIMEEMVAIVAEARRDR